MEEGQKHGGCLVRQRAGLPVLPTPPLSGLQVAVAAAARHWARGRGTYTGKANTSVFAFPSSSTVLSRGEKGGDSFSSLSRRRRGGSLLLPVAAAAGRGGGLVPGLSVCR